MLFKQRIKENNNDDKISTASGTGWMFMNLHLQLDVLHV